MASRFAMRGDVKTEIAEVTKLANAKSNAKMKFVFITPDEEEENNGSNGKIDF
jgi:hypothetical protein